MDDIIFNVEKAIAKKGADEMLKEVYDLAEKYFIHPDVVLDIYMKGVNAYEKVLNEYLKVRKELKQKQ